MTEHRDGDAKFEILPPEERARPPATRTRVSADYDYSGIQYGWLARRRGRALGRALEEQAGGLAITKRYVEAATELEAAQQQLALARARRQLLPTLLEQEQTRLATELANRRGELEAAVDLYADHRSRRAEQREFEAETHTLEMARRKRLVLEEQIAIQRLKEQLKSGSAAQPATPGDSGGADAFNEYLRTETEVRRNSSEADRRINTIYMRAAAERRQLTPSELDEIAALEGAMSAAEQHIRRGGAADF